MKNKFKYSLVLLIFFVTVASSMHAQDLRSDMKSCYNAYANLKNYSSDIKVDIYKTDAASKPFMTFSGHIMKNDKRYYSHFEKSTVLLNDRYMVYVDEDGQYIYYKDLNTVKDKKKLLESPYDMQTIQKSLDSAIAGCDTIQYTGIVNGAKQYYIRSKKLIYLMVLDIDVQTNLLRKLVYYYDKRVMKENNKVTIEFLNASVNPVFGEDAFSEKKYLIINGNRITIADKYRTFDLINDEPKSKR